MKAMDAIRTALKFSDMGMKHLGEMSDAPLLRPGPVGRESRDVDRRAPDGRRGPSAADAAWHAQSGPPLEAAVRLGQRAGR